MKPPDPTHRLTDRPATLGSDMRKSIPKPSQIIEIDSAMAAELAKILKETFGVG